MLGRVGHVAPTRRGGSVPLAAVSVHAGQELEVRNLDLAQPRAGEIEVAIAASGVCHSDLSMSDGKVPTDRPIVLGHEGAGVVAAVGEGVRDLAVGDHVVLTWVAECGECYPCTRGQGYLCEPGQQAANAGSLLDGTTRFSMDGQPVRQMSGLGTF